MLAPVPLRRLLLAAAMLTGSASEGLSQNFDRIAPQQPATPVPQSSLPAPPVAPALPEGSKVLVPALNGLVFVGAADRVVKTGLTRPGITVADGAVMEPEAFAALLAPYLGRPVSLDLLNEIVRRTVLYFREHDRPLVDVVVPEQKIASGTVQIVVVPFVAGAITAEGNEWFSDDLLLSAVRTRRGDPISAQSLLEDINWLNENPFRRTDLVYQRGSNPGESDIVLRTRDRMPLRLFGGYENTGTKTTSENRVLAGFNWGDVLGLGHQMSVQYTASPDAVLRPERRRYTAYALTYQIPLPWRDTLTLMGSHSRSLPSLGDGLRQDGKSLQMSARYALRLPKLDEITHSIEFGADFKRTNNDLEFGGDSVSSGFTDVIQGSVGYVLTRPDSLGASGLAVNLVFSPGDLSGDNTTAAFRPSASHIGRSDADARYAYLRASLQRRTELPEGFAWLARLQGQWASTNLLSSEQLGAGGIDSVRGYGEREANGDNGVLLSNELYAPAISPAKLLGLGSAEDDSLQPFAFWDYGHVAERRPLPGAKGSWTLSSVGLGMRYQMPYGSLRFDWGHAMPGTGLGNSASDRLHVGLTLAY
ncbi:hemolysin activation/secretion protein [Azospirillum agricola]|uniref:ShlB/FhaC/HecB family hemolysin secretion/activation protein n=1 Tax=Azospirillum agricola TaxID=1720247 RepID=UPI001AEB579B|nr:ShlB/FhaC/HecB family hemolysin secretion/activation protein [Azospirillum agricola]MBP2229052.1 hemolysin activation/secretion protein [Azospirillum agricola]